MVVRGRVKDMTGVRYSRLVGVRQAGRTEKQEVVWEFLCDCGNLHLAKGGNVRSGRTKSCGCLLAEKRSSRASDLVGKRFGRLSVLEKTPERGAQGNIIWKCLCDCGNTRMAPTARLNAGQVRSCGCLRIKHGLSRTKEYRRIDTNKRVARKKGAGEKMATNMQVKKMLRRMNYKCLYCGSPHEHIDHILPLSRGGQHIIDNLTASCASCNLSKSNKLLGQEWIPLIVAGWT